MGIYIKVNGVEYPASVYSDNSDHAWGGRRSRAIRLTMTAEEAMALLPDNTPWSIVRREADGTVQEWDDSAFSMSGAVTDNRDGTATGGKITLQFLPHELIGQYFTEATK